MGQGYIRQDTGNNIADGNVIEAADLDGEFDAIVAGFAAVTGHTHDGTTGEGGPIEVVGPAQEYVAAAGSFAPKTDSTYELGTTSLRWSNAYVDTLTVTNGIAVASGGTGATTASGARTNLGVAIGSDVQAYDVFLADIAALTDPGADRILFWDDSAGAMAFLTLGTNLSITDTTINAASGGAGGDAWGDVVDADIVPDADSTRDLGTTGTRFADAFIDTLTLTNALPVASGGTGATTASGARTNLGLGSLATASTINNSNWSGTDLSLANGGTGASLVDPNADRLLFWDDSAGSMAFLTAGSGLTITGTTITATGSGGDAWSDAVDADIVPDTNATRDLGSTSNRFADAFITSLTLTNDLPVTDGGTGASTASGARTNLGLVIGTNVQAQNATLATIASQSNVDTAQLADDAVTDAKILNPSGQVWLAKKTASSSTSLDFTEFDATKYDDYLFVLRDIIPVTDGADLYVRTSTNAGGAYDSGASNYQYLINYFGVGETSLDFDSATTTFAKIAESIDSIAGIGLAGKLELMGPASTTWTKWQGQVSYSNNTTGLFTKGEFSGVRVSAADVDAIRFIMSSGNIASGSITMFGLRNS